MGKNKNKKKGGAQAAAANSNDPDAIKVCKMVILTKLTCSMNMSFSHKKINNRNL